MAAWVTAVSWVPSLAWEIPQVTGKAKTNTKTQQTNKPSECLLSAGTRFKTLEEIQDFSVFSIYADGKLNVRIYFYAAKSLINRIQDIPKENI